jgi:protein-S-isoprenylcysteine O-methyltransferase Ste14
LFRPAAAAPVWRNVTKTLVQSATLWALALWVVPVLIVRLTRGADAADAAPSTLSAAGWALLAAASAGGLWSGLTMAVRGAGTPLPLDHARRLVVAGPYAFVRNPMAIFGLLQGAAVAAILNSPAVLAYVAVGGALWNWVIRPLEERDLAAHYGAAYRHYCDEVRCWVPRFSPWRAAGERATRDRP